MEVGGIGDDGRREKMAYYADKMSACAWFYLFCRMKWRAGVVYGVGVGVCGAEQYRLKCVIFKL